MVTKAITLTRSGREKLERELEGLKNVRRPEVIERIKRSKDYGDLSENAEYEDARNEQSFVEGRIQEIEYILKYAEVIENGKSGSAVRLGARVTVEMEGDQLAYEIVDSTEADPSAGKISSASPIGSALMGKKAGEKVVANTPGGELNVTILKVE